MHPQISVTFSGLVDTNEIVTISIYGDDGRKDIYGTSPGNGSWELSLASLSGYESYSIVVEAEGYAVQPESYQFRIEDKEVYSIQEGQKGNAVKSLYFNFTLLPTASPSPP